MFERREQILLFFLIILFSIVTVFLFERTVMNKDAYQYARYTNKSFIALMEKLIEENVFLIDEEQVVLAENILNESTGKQMRAYLYGPEFYPVIGHWNTVFGSRNLEKVLEAYLSGEIHWPVYTKSSEPFKRMKVGDDIILTIDSRIQHLAYSLMSDKKGAVVVLNIKTGEILCAVSTPSFDPNTIERAQWRDAFMDDEKKPYENRAFSVLYPPGSTFKTIVASAWIEREKNNEMQDGYKVICTGKKNKYGISDIHVHGEEDFHKAYADSCNIFFSEIGVMLGENLLNYAERFAFNREINLIPQLKDYSCQAALSSAFIWRNNKNGENEKTKFNPIDFRRNPKIVAQAAIGQNLIKATPLQMALVASTIANQGVLMNPQIVKEIRRGDGEKILFSAKPIEMGRAIKAKTAIEIKRLMEKVMISGTGKDVKKIYLENGIYTTSPESKESIIVRIAGKTGTAEVGDKNGNGKIDLNEKPHSWFIGFAPASNPKVAIAVIAENQGFGSLTAAPIAVDVLAEALNTRNHK
jgi:peptidoglycan glycosyltransferase